MEIKYYEKDKHYSLLTEWWTKRKHAVIEHTTLPMGVVVYINNEPTCMSFIYNYDGCDMSNIMWTTTNPDVQSREDRHEGIKLALDALISIANKMKKKRIMTLGHSNTFTDILVEKGFVEGGPHVLLIGGL